MKIPVLKKSFEVEKSKSSQRKLNASTTEGSKFLSLAFYNGNKWLIINTNPSNSKLGKSLNCYVFMKYKHLIFSFKEYQEFWCSSDGYVTLQHTSATDHAKLLSTKQHVTNTYAVKA